MLCVTRGCVFSARAPLTVSPCLPGTKAGLTYSMPLVFQRYSGHLPGCEHSNPFVTHSVFWSTASQFHPRVPENCWAGAMSPSELFTPRVSSEDILFIHLNLFQAFRLLCSQEQLGGGEEFSFSSLWQQRGQRIGHASLKDFCSLSEWPWVSPADPFLSFSPCHWLVHLKRCFLIGPLVCPTFMIL
jgi:hypothetical protein